MEFRAPKTAAEQNAKSLKYLTQNLNDPEAGRQVFEGLLDELGNATECYPTWHPLLTAPPQGSMDHVSSLSHLKTYAGIDHTVAFVRGFITCPYSDNTANQLVAAASKVHELSAYRLQAPLYADTAYPVVVLANEVELEADGTIRSRDALAWFAQQSVKAARSAQVAETWWNIRSYILGSPHGSRSSLFVNQNAGAHMRKILEALNNSGMYGPIMESSLEMLSEKKRDTISETLIRTAVANWDKQTEKFEFELRGEICKAAVRDTWDDGDELSIRVEIGEDDLYASGFYYAKNDQITHSDPTGKRALAEKFL